MRLLATTAVLVHAIPVAGQRTVACGDSYSGSTSGATDVGGEPSGDSVAQFCVQSNMLVTFDACSSRFDTVLHVYADDGGSGPGVLVAECDDDDSTAFGLALESCGGCGVFSRTSKMEVTLASGCYNVLLDGYGTAEGFYTISIE